MVKYLHGDWSLAEAIHKIQRDTRRYAKRQMTWFKADPEVIWINPEDFHIVLHHVRDFILDNTA
jgi:tRNA dimethylallyltransferase